MKLHALTSNRNPKIKPLVANEHTITFFNSNHADATQNQRDLFDSPNPDTCSTLNSFRDVVNHYRFPYVQLYIMFFFFLLSLSIITLVNSLPKDFDSLGDMDSFYDTLDVSETSSPSKLIADCTSDDSSDDAVGDDLSISRRQHTEGTSCSPHTMQIGGTPPIRKFKIKSPSTQELEKVPDITALSDPDCLTFFGFPNSFTCSGGEYSPDLATNIVKIVLNCAHGMVPEIEARPPFEKAIVVAQYCCKEFIPVTPLSLSKNRYIDEQLMISRIRSTRLGSVTN